MKPNRRRLERIRRGIEPDRTEVSAVNGFGPWRSANVSNMKQAFPKRSFDGIGLAALSDLKLSRTIQSEPAVYGTVCTVVCARLSLKSPSCPIGSVPHIGW